jgi:hypothetical protein
MLGSSALGDGVLGGDAGDSGPVVFSISLPITVTVTEDVVETLALPIRVSIAVSETLALPIQVTITSTSTASLEKWRPVVVIGGVDISTRLTGFVRIEAGEGEARLADFYIMPASGTVILPDWTGKSVTIDIAEQNSLGEAVNPIRVFTGVVDEPEYDLTEGTIHFECVDQLQQVIRNTPRSWVDENVQGYYSEAIFGEIRDTLQYADSQISTVPASFDLDPFQTPRVTPWELSTGVIELNEENIWDGGISVSFATRNDILNEITVGFKYRFPRLRARVASVEFSREVNQYVSQGLDIPNRSLVEQAVKGVSSWTHIGEINYVPIDPGTYEAVGSGGSTFTTISVTDAPKLTLGFAARFTNRWVQWITESYSIKIFNLASVESIGRIADIRDGVTLDVEFDEGAWQSDPSAKPLLTYPTTGDVVSDYGGDGKTDRASAQNAIETEIARVRREILASHRKTLVKLIMPCRPSADIVDRYEITVPRLHAIGKASRVIHTLSLESGEADTEIHVSVSGVSAVGLQPDDEITTPDAPVDTTPSPDPASLLFECGFYIGQVSEAPVYDPDTMIGYLSNARLGAGFDSLAPAYPFEISIKSPEIEAAVRNPLDLPKPAEYQISIPQDTLEIITP